MSAQCQGSLAILSFKPAGEYERAGQSDERHPKGAKAGYSAGEAIHDADTPASRQSSVRAAARAEDGKSSLAGA